MPGLLRLRGLAPVLRPRLQPRLQLRQGSGMGAGGPRGYGQGEYRGLKVPKPEPWQSNVATFYGSMLWLWIFYRFKQDGKALFVRGPGTRTLFPGRRPDQADSTLVAQLSSCFPACGRVWSIRGMRTATTTTTATATATAITNLLHQPHAQLARHC